MSRHELRNATLGFQDEPDRRGVEAFFDRWAPRRTILELGASGSSVTLLLARAGFTVVVADRSSSAIREVAARSGAEAIYFIQTDLTRTPLEELFGAVILGPTTTSQPITLRTQIEFLNAAADHIVDNGVVIVETATPPQVRESTAMNHPISRRPDGLRFPALAELDLIAGLAGLRLIHRASDFGATPLQPQHHRAISVYERGPAHPRR